MRKETQWPTLYKYCPDFVLFERCAKDAERFQFKTHIDFAEFVIDTLTRTPLLAPYLSPEQAVALTGEYIHSVNVLFWFREWAVPDQGETTEERYIRVSQEHLITLNKEGLMEACGFAWPYKGWMKDHKELVHGDTLPYTFECPDRLPAFKGNSLKDLPFASFASEKNQLPRYQKYVEQYKASRSGLWHELMVPLRELNTPNSELLTFSPEPKQKEKQKQKRQASKKQKQPDTLHTPRTRRKAKRIRVR